MASPRESSSQGPQRKWEYDVFLSFRGEDTRKNFTDQLYVALNQKGIITYRDDPSLEKGQNISTELLKAIENSKYLVVIISEDYASSTWCLEELTKIVECMKGGEQMAIPIFYNIDPSHVRKQNGSFKRAFVKHEKTFKYNMDKVQRWRNAMKEIADLCGWDSRKRQYESHLIRDIIKDLQNKLGRNLLYAPKNLVGMESRIEDMFLHLSLGSDDVRIVGISGMAGIGKSTLARVVFDKISAQFEGCSFLANIKDVCNNAYFDLVTLQNRLLSDIIQEKDLIKDNYMGQHMIEDRLNTKKVLVVLDDVDDRDQIDFLAKKQWFGRGSRIIITTRDECLLRGADAVHKAKELSSEEAQKLFFSKSFEENNITEEFEDLSKKFIEYAQGLPLAISVLGSSLYKGSVDEWERAFKRLQKNLDKKIFATLKSGFDRLEHYEKAIFLDIACFFNGKDKNYIMEILDCCGFDPEIRVEILLQKSLLIVIDNKFMVHDLLREMAWEVVKQESPEELGKQSRLKHIGDIDYVMKTNTGTERIEGIFSKEHISTTWDADCFTKMTNLRLLEIPKGISISEIKFLPNKLRLLKWDGFPSSSLPASLLPACIYELRLRSSSLRQLSTGQKSFPKLKIIDLSGSKYLTRTPDFNLMPNLEKLILGACEKLSRIHPSIGILQHLRFLDLRGCKNLRKIPPSIGNLRSLKVLHLGGCSNLKELPDSIWSLECLQKLSIGETAIAHLPPNLTNLKNLKVLSCGWRKRKLLDYCLEVLLSPQRKRRMWSGLLKFWFGQAPVARGIFLPSLSGLSSLKELDISRCDLQEGEIPNDLGCLSSLRKLNLSYNPFFTIPESINQIPRLEYLGLNSCENLQALPRLPDSVSSVRCDGCMKLNSISNPFIIFTVRRSITLSHEFGLLPGDLEFPLVLQNSLVLLCFIRCCSALQGEFGKLYAVAPNCEIPNWFTYQKVGSLLSFRIRDPGFTSKGSGFAICVSFLRQEQECSESEQVTYSNVNLICEFNVGGNQLGHSFHFRIRFITSNSVWMGFVPLQKFPSDTKWEEIIDERIDVSLWTVNDKSKIIKCGIVPLYANQKAIPSTCSSPEDLSSIFHELECQEVVYDFSSSGDKEEREDHREIPTYAIPCGEFVPIKMPHVDLPTYDRAISYLRWRAVFFIVGRLAFPMSLAILLLPRDFDRFDLSSFNFPQFINRFLKNCWACAIFSILGLALRRIAFRMKETEYNLRKIKEDILISRLFYENKWEP